MEAYAYILYRLVLFWKKVPPEVAVAGLLAAPGVVGFLAGLPWILDLAAGGFLSWWAAGIFEAHIRPELTPEHRRLLARLQKRVLLMPPDQEPPLLDHRDETDNRKGTMKRIDEGSPDMDDLSPKVPTIYWWEVAGAGPLLMNLAGARYFSFFSSEEKARAFREGQAAPLDVVLNRSDRTADIVRLVRHLHDDERCDDFLMSPRPEPGSWSETRSADQMVELIEYTARRNTELGG